MSHRTCHKNMHRCHSPIIKGDKLMFCQPIIEFCGQLRAFSNVRLHRRHK
jgi:hypothetical protein